MGGGGAAVAGGGQHASLPTQPQRNFRKGKYYLYMVFVISM